MKILFCNFEYPPLGGGGGVINALLAEELASRHEVTVLTSQGLDLPFKEEINGVRIIRVPVYFRRQQATASMGSMLAYLPMGIRAGRKLLSGDAFDVINTHFVLPSGPVGDALSVYSGIPNILSVHGGDLYDPSKFSSPHKHLVLRLWINRLLRRANAVVGQSENTLQNMRKFYTPEIEGIRIPLGIKRPGAVEPNREKSGFTRDDFLFVTVGRLVARKSIDQLISVIGQLQEKNIHLLVVGTGPKEALLREQAGALGLDGQVHFMGHVSDDEKYRILKMSDVFISSSQHEGFGIVYLEAMAMGLPVICYDYGGQTDFLDDRKTGRVIPLNDTVCLFEACREMVRDRSGREQAGEENISRVEDLFIDSCARHYERVFDAVISGS